MVRQSLPLSGRPARAALKNAARTRPFGVAMGGDRVIAAQQHAPRRPLAHARGHPARRAAPPGPSFWRVDVGHSVRVA